MAARLLALGFDANDPPGLARFWAEALGWEVGDATDDAVHLVPTDGTTFGVVFRRTPEPKVVKNRIHLDLTTRSLDDQRSSVARLVELGARPIDVGQGPEEEHVVLADPEGNELCLIEPGNRFLAGCGRLGALSCDGFPAVGYFWRAALGWPLVWDQDDETAIRESESSGAHITWGPPVVPKVGPNRLRLEVEADVDDLLSLGARRVDDAASSSGAGVVLADPEDNELVVVPAAGR